MKNTKIRRSLLAVGLLAAIILLLAPSIARAQDDTKGPVNSIR
jgi:hypothetical protein